MLKLLLPSCTVIISSDSFLQCISYLLLDMLNFFLLPIAVCRLVDHCSLFSSFSHHSFILYTPIVLKAQYYFLHYQYHSNQSYQIPSQLNCLLTLTFKIKMNPVVFSNITKLYCSITYSYRTNIV
jgi:hypothetical protein